MRPRLRLPRTAAPAPRRIDHGVEERTLDPRASASRSSSARAWRPGSTSSPSPSCTPRGRGPSSCAPACRSRCARARRADARRLRRRRASRAHSSSARSTTPSAIPGRRSTSSQEAGFGAVGITSFWQPGLSAPPPEELAVLRGVAARAGETRIFLGVYHPGSATTPLTAEARAQFAAYVAAIVRDVPEIRDVIVGNEPNLNRFWLPQFDEAGERRGRAGLPRAARRGRTTPSRRPTRDVTDLGRRAGAARDRPARHGPRHPLPDDVHPRPRRGLPRERPHRPAARRLRLPSLPGELEHPARPPDRSGLEVDPDGRLRGEAAAAARRGVRARPARALQRARRRDRDPAGEGARSTRATSRVGRSTRRLRPTTTAARSSSPPARRTSPACCSSTRTTSRR